MSGRTIVYLPNWLGDMVMAVPFLMALREQKKEVIFLGKSKAVHLYHGLGLFDRFIPLDGNRPILSVAMELKKDKYELGIVLPHSLRSALTLYLGGVKDRIGYSGNLRSPFLTFRLKRERRPFPTVEHYLRIGDFLGLRRLIDYPVLKVTDDEEESFFSRFGELREPYCVFCVGASYGPSKIWPHEYFSELAKMIVKSLGIRIYIPVGEEDYKRAFFIRDASGEKDAVNVSFMNVRDLKVLISKALFLVTNDTGPRHIGSSLGIHTFVLVGPMDETYTAYPSENTHLLKVDVECRPCNRKICVKEHECLRGITPYTVFESIQGVLGNEESFRSN